MNTARFTVAGAYSGYVYADQCSAETAADWARGYVKVNYDLAEFFASLDVAQSWSSHPPHSGIGLIVRRVS